MDRAMKPSILHAHTGIGSSDDIDRYGVWIKSEPEDWTENPDGFNLDTFDDFSDNRVHKKSLDSTSDFLEADEETGELPQFPGEDDIIAEDAADDTEYQIKADAQDYLVEKDVSEHEGAPATVQESTLKLEKLQTELLQTIASELTAIKREIESLKGEFSTISKKEAGAAKIEAESAEGDSKVSGFFDDDDDDDVIVLTEEELVHLESDVTDIEAEAEPEAAEPAAVEVPEACEESIVKTEAETLSSGEIDKILDNAEITTELHDKEAAIIEEEILAETEKQELPEEAGEMPVDEALSSAELANIFNTADLVEEIGAGHEVEAAETQEIPEQEILDIGEIENVPIETEFDPVLENNDLDAGLPPEEPEEIPELEEESVEPLETLEEFDDAVQPIPAQDVHDFSNVTVELEDEDKPETDDTFDPFEELETNLAGQPSEPEPEEELTIDAAAFSEPAEEAIEQTEAPAAVTDKIAAGGPEGGLNFTLEDFTPALNEAAAAPPPFSLSDIPPLPDFDTATEAEPTADEAAELPDFDIAAEAEPVADEAAELPDFDISAEAEPVADEAAELPDFDIAAEAEPAADEAAELPDFDIAAEAELPADEAADLPDFDIAAEAEPAADEATELPDFDIAAEAEAEPVVDEAADIPDFDISAEAELPADEAAELPDFDISAEAEPAVDDAADIPDFDISAEAEPTADEAAELPDFSGLITEETDGAAAKAQDSEAAAIEQNLEDGLLDAKNKDTEKKHKEKKKGGRKTDTAIPDSFKKELKTVLTYMDKLLEALPDDKIAEFARSEQFEIYKKLFKDLDIS